MRCFGTLTIAERFPELHAMYAGASYPGTSLWYELESDRKFLNPIYTNDVIDKVIELERRDQREIAIRPHPHEFYLYFDV